VHKAKSHPTNGLKVWVLVVSNPVMHDIGCATTDKPGYISSPFSPSVPVQIVCDIDNKYSKYDTDDRNHETVNDSIETHSQKNDGKAEREYSEYWTTKRPYDNVALNISVTIDSKYFEGNDGILKEPVHYPMHQDDESHCNIDYSLLFFTLIQNVENSNG
jgi:hypothetical protein